MSLTLRRGLVAAASLIALGGGALAQDSSAMLPTSHVSLDTPAPALGSPLSQADQQGLMQALNASKYGDSSRIRAAMDGIEDPLARKIALWALVDSAPESLSYAELDGARRDLTGWPRAARRSAAAEKVLETGGLSSKGIVDWFAGADPATAQGAMALASAYQATGQAPKAAELIRRVWRAKCFDSAAQAQMLGRFGILLTPDDHAARIDALLYGNQDQAARELLPLLAPDKQAIAEARMAVRAGAADADARVAALPAADQVSPGLAFERAVADERQGRTADALALVPYFPTNLPDDDSAATRMWKLRGALVIGALRAGDSHGAYLAASNSGIASGQDAAEAEFYAGWLALDRLKDPKAADDHFARLQSIGASPITQGRALYWRGRAAEAAGDQMNAQLFYADAARFPTTFYGQLASAKAGETHLSLGHDPEVTAADRARFESREEIRAARLMYGAGAKDSFKSFVNGLAETLPTAAEEAQLVDLARGYGDQELSMRVVRTAAKRGFILPERGYPIRTPPITAGAPETAFILAITRQESSFDPHIRSGAGATGMMQLMPATAQILSHHMGLGSSAGRLEDPDFNMQLGSAYLGQLVGQFSGSYVMAAAAYNAGPGRPVEWSSFCGDPRSSSTDPVDFIECIPFNETRDYVMRVLEATQVYRARLNAGTAPLTLPTDLKRGGYGYGSFGPAVASNPAPVLASNPPPGGQNQASR